MTRKQRAQNNETWDLSSSRGAQALRAAILTEEEQAGGAGAGRGGASSASNSSGKGAGGGRRARAAAHASERRVPFQLREDVAAMSTGAGPFSSSQATGAVAGNGAAARPGDAEAFLARRLGPSAAAAAGPALIREVLSGCGGDAGAALDALMAMLGVVDQDREEEEGGLPQQAAAASNATNANDDHHHHHWGALHPSLPSELQDLVLQQLPVRDLSRCACAGRALRAAARREMRRARTVPAPAGVTAAELRGMTTALQGAATADLSRALAGGPPPGDEAVPEDALHARMAREQQVGLLLRALAEGAALRLAAAATARGGGGASPGGVVPLSRLVFARGAAEGLTDYALRSGVLGLAPSDERPPLPHVRELAATRAPLTSAGLHALARHRALLGVVSGGGEEQRKRSGGGSSGEEEAEEAPAATTTPTTSSGFEALSLVECPGVRDDGVRALLSTQPCRGSLARLDVSGCPSLTSAAFRGLHAPGVGLRSLKAANLPQLSGPLALLLPHGHPLEELDLSGCARLQSLLINAPKLRELRLRGCSRLASLAGKFPALEQLVAADSPSLAFFAGGQAATATDPIAPFFAPSLRIADFKGCAAMGDAAARGAVLSDGQGRAPRLEALNLSATAVTSLEWLGEERAPRLRKLDVSGCRSLERLSVGGGALRELLAGGCRALRSLTLLAPQRAGLARLQLSNCAGLSAVAVGRRADVDGGAGGAGGGAGGGGAGARGAPPLNLDGTPLMSPADEAALRALFFA